MSSRSRKSETGSTRAKKVVTTTTVLEESAAEGEDASPGPSTPLQQKSGVSPGRRPPSPTFILRKQEKDELCHLNDRLAAYIDRVRQLETENRTLTTRIRSFEETSTRETSNIKSLYETELADARRQIDDLAKDKSRVEIEFDAYKKKNGGWKEKYDKVVANLELTEKRLLDTEGQVGDLQARLNDTINQKKHWENECARLRKELDSVNKQLATALKQLESESVRVIDLSNQIQTLREQSEFNGKLHSQELNESRMRSEIEIEEVDAGLKGAYESKLAEALSQMREENNYQIHLTREETEAVFSKKLEELRRIVESQESMTSTSTDELHIARRLADELSAENMKLKTQLAAAAGRVTMLEAQLARQAEEHSVAIGHRDAEIRRLRQELADQLTEYQDLMDIKIALDMEIAAYRKMLEGEEARLNIESPRRTPLRATVGSKRYRTGEMVAHSGSFMRQSAAQGYTTSAASTGQVEVYETSEDGSYIKLFNNSDVDVSLGTWTLEHKAGDEHTAYKFHRSSHIAGGGYVTVWSMDADTAHEPPENLVMKSQKWFTGDSMKTTLQDKDGAEVASREMVRSMERRLYIGDPDDVDSGFEAGSSYRRSYRGESAAQNGEKCAIM